mgnify:CR=1 FL=1
MYKLPQLTIVFRVHGLDNQQLFKMEKVYMDIGPEFKREGVKSRDLEVLVMPSNSIQPHEEVDRISLMMTTLDLHRRLGQPIDIGLFGADGCPVAANLLATVHNIRVLSPSMYILNLTVKQPILEKRSWVFRWLGALIPASWFREVNA